MKKKKATTKTKAKKSSGASQAAGLTALRREIATLEKEIMANKGNESMEDALEDKIELLEDKVDLAKKDGKISLLEAEELENTLDRLEDIVD